MTTGTGVKLLAVGSRQKSLGTAHLVVLWRVKKPQDSSLAMLFGLGPRGPVGTLQFYNFIVYYADHKAQIINSCCSSHDCPPSSKWLIVLTVELYSKISF